MITYNTKFFVLAMRRGRRTGGLRCMIGKGVRTSAYLSRGVDDDDGETEVHRLRVASL